MPVRKMFSEVLIKKLNTFQTAIKYEYTVGSIVYS